jgi:dolichol-phosphate mannosyltransferase
VTTGPDAGPRRLAIVVPMMNEQEGLPHLLAALDALPRELPGIALEFVLVDDGSTDATWAELQRLTAGRADVRLARHERNAGVSAAIRTGILATDAPFVASIDADLTYDPRELAAMLRLADGADLVTASPYHPDGAVAGVPRWRLFLSRSLSRGYRLLTGSTVHTWTSCCRIYRRASVADLPLDYPGFLGQAEWLVRVQRRGGGVREHPCTLSTRRYGLSKMRVLRTILGHLGLLWRVLWRQVG